MLDSNNFGSPGLWRTSFGAILVRIFFMVAGLALYEGFNSCKYVPCCPQNCVNHDYGTPTLSNRHVAFLSTPYKDDDHEAQDLVHAFQARLITKETVALALTYTHRNVAAHAHSHIRTHKQAVLRNLRQLRAQFHAQKAALLALQVN